MSKASLAFLYLNGVPSHLLMTSSMTSIALGGGLYVGKYIVTPKTPNDWFFLCDYQLAKVKGE